MVATIFLNVFFQTLYTRMALLVSITTWGRDLSCYSHYTENANKTELSAS